MEPPRWNWCLGPKVLAQSIDAYSEFLKQRAMENSMEPANVLASLCPHRIGGEAGELIQRVKLDPDDLTAWAQLHAVLLLHRPKGNWSSVPGDSMRENVMLLASVVLLRRSFEKGVELLLAVGDLLRADAKPRGGFGLWRKDAGCWFGYSDGDTTFATAEQAESFGDMEFLGDWTEKWEVRPYEAEV